MEIGVILFKIFDEGFYDFCQACGGRAENGAGTCVFLRFDSGSIHFHCATSEAAVFDLKIAQEREGGLERELVAVAGVDARHERLDQVFVGGAPHAERDKSAETFVFVPFARGQDKIKPDAQFLEGIEQAGGEHGHHFAGDHHGETIGEADELIFV